MDKKDVGSAEVKKLLKLKEWLTISDAARYLMSLLEEEVRVADVLRLGLDRRLRLSVYFVNGTRATQGKVVPIAEAETYVMAKDFVNDPRVPLLQSLRGTIGKAKDNDFPPEVLEGLRDGSLHLVLRGISLDKDHERVLELEDTVQTIRGVWDLPLIGAEILDVEHAWQQEADGHEVTGMNLDGAFVAAPDGTLWQLQESFDSPEMRAMQKDVGMKLESLGVKTKKDSESDAVTLDAAARRNRRSRFFPAGGLPKDGMFVVRTTALEAFQADLRASLFDEPPVAGGSKCRDEKREQKPDRVSDLSRKLKTYQKLALAMAMERYGWNPNSTRPQSATGEKDGIPTAVGSVFSEALSADIVLADCAKRSKVSKRNSGRSTESQSDRHTRSFHPNSDGNLPELGPHNRQMWSAHFCAAFMYGGTRSSM